jgi:hypothetical protein
VIITPMNLPPNLRDRRAAIKPTRVKTESRTSLLPLAEPFIYELRERGASSVRGTEVHVLTKQELRARNVLTPLFGTIPTTSVSYPPFQCHILTPAVPYVYTCPSGGGCVFAASTIGSDMLRLQGLKWYSLPKNEHYTLLYT